MARLEVRGIRKSFGPVHALRGVDFKCLPAEVHAILGENGAGKSTLMNVVSGLISTDSGDMWLDGAPYRPSSPQQAMRHGVGMVHQDYQLVERLSVSENIFIGWAGAPRVASKARLAAAAALAITRYGFHLDPLATIRELSVGEQQRVAILRALVRGASVLILDEPTAALTPQEATALFGIMRSLVDDGKTIIFITHKLREVMEIASQVTVLRAGSRIASYHISQCDEHLLAREMLGRDVESLVRERGAGTGEAGITLNALNISVRDDRGLLAVDGVSLAVRSNEIVGVAAVAGNGQRELSEALTGVRSLASGCVEVRGEDLTGSSAAAFAKAGVGYIPEDRLGAGMMVQESVARNSILKALHDEADHARLTWHSWLRLREVNRFARELLEQGQVSTLDPTAVVGNLSGGNIQRLLIAREVRAARHVLVAVHPTLGLDVGATERTWQILLDARGKGVGVLLISEDLDEILTLADRILVMHAGRIVGDVDNRDTRPSREHLGLLMGGSASLVSHEEPSVVDDADVRS
ncbi:MAG: ABC transporter ATP-binding protein [Acidimicrobiales bacterium]